MKHNLLLTISSLVSILFMTFHMTQDTLHARAGSLEAGGSTLVAVPILVVWLYGTLLLGERRSGHVIMLIGSILAMGMPVIHVMGPRGIFSVEFAKYSGAFLVLLVILHPQRERDALLLPISARTVEYAARPNRKALRDKRSLR